MAAAQPNKPGRPIYPPKPASAAPPMPGAPLSYAMPPRPPPGRIQRAWRWWKYHVEGPVGNVLAVAFIIALIAAYVYVRQARRAHLQEIRTNRLQTR
jgi:hypothetical protein